MHAARLGALSLAVLALVAAPAVATAATVAVEGGTLTFHGEGGEKNSETITPTDARYIGVDDSGAYVKTGAACYRDTFWPFPYYEAKCESANVTSVEIHLGPGSDQGGARIDLPVALFGDLGSDSLVPPAHGLADGGPGDDFLSFYGDGDSTVSGGPGSDTVEYYTQSSYGDYHGVSLSVTLDGRPGDGAGSGQQYNVMPDVENVIGGDAPDRITGSDSANRVDGNLADDTIATLGGNDTVEARDVFHDDDPHHPPVDYQPTRDVIDCGAGIDTVRADRLDAVSANCERVYRYAFVSHYDEGRDQTYESPRLELLTLRGSSGPDRLTGARSAPNRILGRGGADRLTGGRRSDSIDAGSGDDRVRVRDRSVDIVRCGGGRDTVIADANDQVGRSCERVIVR